MFFGQCVHTHTHIQFLFSSQLYYISSDLRSSLSLGPLEHRVLHLLSLTIRNAVLLFISHQVSLPSRSRVCEVLDKNGSVFCFCRFQGLLWNGILTLNHRKAANHKMLHYVFKTALCKIQYQLNGHLLLPFQKHWNYGGHSVLPGNFALMKTYL